MAQDEATEDNGNADSEIEMNLESFASNDKGGENKSLESVNAEKGVSLQPKRKQTANFSYLIG